MYNMNISIFGFKLNLEILILIGVIYLILVFHTLYGCANCSLMEGLEMIKAKVATDASGTLLHDLSGNLSGDLSGNIPMPALAGTQLSSKKGSAGKEGFAGANTNYGQSSPFDLTNDTMINTSSWSMPDLTVTPGKPLNPAVKQFLARQQQPLPLQEGQMDFLANVQFKPECCPNTYSNSTGCACMTSKDYNYLIMRGGNNVPYSEY